MDDTKTALKAAPTAAPTATPPRIVDVEVRIFRDQNEPDGVRFEMDSALPPGKGHLNFKNRNHPGFLVNFNINDVDGTGYLFPNRLDEALWVKPIIYPNDKCPDTACQWGQFQAQDVTNGNQTLEVRNYNQYVQEFGFTLRFTKDPDYGPYVPFDPVGNNQNGDQ